MQSESLKPHLGRYELLAKLASGGMGEVFLARLEGAAGFEKLYAVKRILPHLAGDLRFRGMLIDEARIASKLSHPNVCQVYELGETGGELYIAMEYLEGVTLLPLLRNTIQHGQLLGLGLIAGIIQQIAEGLHYAHELRDRDGTPLNIVHRDVTPSNIYVTESGVAKVLDFGIAKARTISSNTQTGTIKGKHAYMAPEQLRGATLDRRVDVFAVGVLLFEMLALRRLFQRRTDYLTLQAVMEEPIPDVRMFRDDLPEPLVAALGHALERDRDRRFETVRQLSAAVTDAVSTVDRVWSPGQLSEHLAERFGGELERRNTAILSAVARPADADGNIPSLEDLEVHGRNTAVSDAGYDEVEGGPVDDAGEDDDDDLPSLGSEVRKALEQPTRVERTAAPSGPMGSYGSGPMVGYASGPVSAVYQQQGRITGQQATLPRPGSATGPQAAMAMAMQSPATGTPTGQIPSMSMPYPSGATGQMPAMPHPHHQQHQHPYSDDGGSGGGSGATGQMTAMQYAGYPGMVPGALHPATLPPAAAIPLRGARRTWLWGVFATALLGIATAALVIVWRTSQQTPLVMYRETVPLDQRGSNSAVADDDLPIPTPVSPEGLADGSGSRSGSGVSPNKVERSDGKRPRDERRARAEPKTATEVLQARVNGLRPGVARCMGKHNAESQNVAGTAVLTIEASGKVSKVEIEPAPLAKTPLAACIQSVFIAERFPEQRAGGIEIGVPFSTKTRPQL